MSSSVTLRARVMLAIATLLLFSAWTGRGQDGIYADFQTSMGDFSCRLEYTYAPKAVANFIALASGSQPWLDMKTGTVRNGAFYDGLTFHRAITNFMIQGGSPNGFGTDGPGYAFTDEFTSSLTFSKPWMLAMANSGPDSNGAQFFLTVAPTAWLNNRHTIFGRVVSGTNVVDAISKVPTDDSDKPLTTVVIQHVGIRRVGSAAQAFNIGGQGLPTVTNLPLRVSLSNTGQVALTFSNRLYSQNRAFSSTNLVDWTEESVSIETGEPMTNRAFRGTSGDGKFYRFAQTQYPASTLAPKTLANRKLTLSLGVAMTFDAALGGTFTYGGKSGTITMYFYNQGVYNGSIPFASFSNYVYPMSLNLNFTKATGGSFTGTSYGTGASLEGTFTLSAPLP